MFWSQVYRRPKHVLWSVLLCALATTLPINGCASGDSNQAADVRSAPARLSRPYARGRWRLLSLDEQNRIVLWLRHLWIRHADSRTDGLPAFRAYGWQPEDVPPKRTRAEALELARRLADQLKRDPTRFEQLARQYSDDISTREQGGKLAGTHAPELAPVFIDALRAIEWDTASEVLETSEGFHIVKKLRPPPDQQVAGQHVVVRYAGTVGADPTAKATRGREQALARAKQIAASTRPFAELVRDYSEADDRSRGGDLGVWSTIAPDHNGPLLDVLAHLGVGEVSAPIDSAVGFHVLKRVPVSPRDTLATTVIRLSYDATLIDDSHSNSRAAVGKEAQALADRIRNDPAGFVRLQSERCCDEVLQWAQGRGSPALESALADLTIGAVAARAVDDGWFYLIPKRLPPTTTTQPPPVYEIPDPEAPDLEGLLRNSDGSALATSVRGMRPHVQADQALTAAARTQLDQVLADLALKLEQAKTPDERVQADRQARETVVARVDAPTAKRFFAFAQQWVVDEIMKLTP
jgi:hypothetical protein